MKRPFLCYLFASICSLAVSTAEGSTEQRDGGLECPDVATYGADVGRLFCVNVLQQVFITSATNIVAFIMNR